MKYEFTGEVKKHRRKDTALHPCSTRHHGTQRQLKSVSCNVVLKILLNSLILVPYLVHTNS